MTAEGAAQWIREKAIQFEELGPKILDLQHRAAEYTAKARAAGDEAEAAGGRRLVESIGFLLRAHQSVLNQLTLIAGAIPGLVKSPVTLGIIPLVIPIAMAAAVIALAGAMALIFRRVTAEEKAVDLLEAGSITAVEAIELVKNIEGGGGLLEGLTGAPQLLLLAAAGYVVYRLVQRWA